MWAALGKFLLGLVSNLLTVWLAKNAGKKEARADANEKALDAVRDANRPNGDDDIAIVRDRYRRD